MSKIKPYNSDSSKTKEVETMFDNIAHSYDFMNTVMSFGLHRLWRNKALRLALKRLNLNNRQANILDVATGTGDLVFHLHRLLPKATITGIDLSSGMLNIARRKLNLREGTAAEKITFAEADCLDLPFKDDSFDLVTVAYGVRNFEEIGKGLAEMARVLRPGGTLCVIELSEPKGKIPRRLYKLYTRTLIPSVGRLVSHDHRAYTYLPESIAAAPQRERLTALMKAAGLSNPQFIDLSFGAATIYLASK
ncbi:MAG: bifunctional demethylmenaquinone methyltransferase/2-methoxy-6-polyprenyl-1,4-benzoquinol methylase UbiE [Muribaculaceae bacterium]|nr:bifunctional demethylmenaquinone methyltransferase/2-methoxy-6-polyprenyl-1,4-benzoquinol methylase UbiE [Bacteroidales bacterium]MBD5208380.1 bifunctional demethylmenaquinone methyltransferase/2-methoxy-6-polyprenyl-1,4-benzoquinol methylase UbiE [Bacteroidales bacterium]MDE6084583.1 bifunctional demethylmenaquinone methyltransferase/2-methoxy-6-polyprenyl-1,4-benzoquinol methylase UbiE [Muribaculaceae bacterium]